MIVYYIIGDDMLFVAETFDDVIYRDIWNSDVSNFSISAKCWSKLETSNWDITTPITETTCQTIEEFFESYPELLI